MRCLEAADRLARRGLLDAILPNPMHYQAELAGGLEGLDIRVEMASQVRAREFANARPVHSRRSAFWSTMAIENVVSVPTLGGVARGQVSGTLARADSRASVCSLDIFNDPPTIFADIYPASPEGRSPPGAHHQTYMNERSSQTE